MIVSNLKDPILNLQGCKLKYKNLKGIHIDQDDCKFNEFIKNAFQLGFTYEVSERFNLNAVYHHGDSGGKTSGQLLNPGFISSFPPYGAIPGSNVSYDMTTDLFMVGFNYTFKRKQVNNNDQ